MTYLFVVVGIAVINALSNKKTSYAELALTNATIILAAFFLEKAFTNGGSKLSKQSIVYDNLSLLHPDQHQALIDDIGKRTGLLAQKVKISKIDLQKGSANITVHYLPSQPDDLEDDG
jgi:hypothetical protein